MASIRNASSATGKFAQISNDLIRNEELSVLARFIVCYVLSLPPDHHFTAEWLESKLPGYGTRSIRAALGELKAHGYMKVARTSHGRGKWEWDQVISDAPLGEFTEERSGTHETTCGNVSSQASSSARPSPDDGRADKDLKTEEPKDEVQKMAQERVSRRGRASSAAAQRTPAEAIRDIRTAVSINCSQEDADSLTDGQVLGLYYRFCKPKTTVVRDLVAHMGKLLADATYVDTLLANSTPVCIPCWHYESDCHCAAESAA